MSDAPAIALAGIRKAFGPVQALRGADFVLAPGEVHALLGENGAGKSTLMHIAGGMIRPDTGTITISGEAVVLRSPREARARGLGMVHQHFTSIGALTVRENLALALGPKARTPAPIPDRLRAGLDPGAVAERLPVALRQRLEIVKALATGARALLLDEPTALLAPSEVEELLGFVREFARDGGSVALITHKLPEVFAAADRVTVLRQGAVAHAGPIAGETERSLAEAMIGGAPGELPGKAEAPAATGDGSGAPMVRIGGLVIRSGEVVGIAAVEGNGQRELLRAIAGLPGVTRRDVEVDGIVAFVPEDRTTEGLIPALTITENVVLGLQDDRRWARGIRLDWGAARRRAGELIEEFDIRAPGPDALAGTLSGGNQQKLVLARALEREPRVLVAENPTRGLDIRATEGVHRRLREAAGRGVAVIVHSTDLDEVLGLADRIFVVHRGRVSEAPQGAGRKEVGELMLGIGA
jgi:simple sugar transport system ATP-binding protein